MISEQTKPRWWYEICLVMSGFLSSMKNKKPHFNKKLHVCHMLNELAACSDLMTSVLSWFGLIQLCHLLLYAIFSSWCVLFWKSILCNPCRKFLSGVFSMCVMSSVHSDKILNIQMLLLLRRAASGMFPICCDAVLGNGNILCLRISHSYQGIAISLQNAWILGNCTGLSWFFSLWLSFVM